MNDHKLIYVTQENMDDLVNTWNRNRENNNCYAFAFDHLKLGATDKLQPGELSGLQPLNDDEYTCSALNARVLQDNPGVMLSSSPQCQPGYRAVALFIDNTGEHRDYHFYRQMKRCAGNTPSQSNEPCAPGHDKWAHKPGSKRVTFVDDAGNEITDPRLADRDYVNDGDELAAFNYDQFCSFFCVPAHEPADEPKEVPDLPDHQSDPHRVRWLLCLAALLVVIGLVMAIWLN
jgi:hypothetical protein